MQVSELFDIEPSHTDVNEVSRRRIYYGDGYAPVGYATLWLTGRVADAGRGDREVIRISGVRGEYLFVRYEHSRRAEPYFWVHASLFPDGIEILAKVRQPLPERYWHPAWRAINALPPLAAEQEN